MSRSAMTSPLGSTRKAPRDADEIRTIALATEAAFERVRTARERLETRRRAKSMPNTPVASEFGQSTRDTRADRAMQETQRGGAGATRLDFSNAAMEIEGDAHPLTREHRREDEAEKDAKMNMQTRDGQEKDCRVEREDLAQGDRAELASAMPSVLADLPKSDKTVNALLIEAMDRCRKLEVVETDEEDDIADEVGAAIARKLTDHSHETVRRGKEKRVSERFAVRNPELLKPPDFYRNSAHSSAVSLDASGRASPKKPNAENAATEDSCSLM